MKILHVLETSGGGSGRHVLGLAAGQSKSGLDVSVVWSPVRAQPGFVKALSGLKRVKNYPVNMYRSVGFRDISAHLSLRKTIKKLGHFDIINGHSSKAGAFVRLLPSKLATARVYTPHSFRTMDPGVSKFSRIIYGSTERLLAQRTDALIAVSAAEARHARKIGIPKSVVSTVVNGVDPITAKPQADVRDSLGIPDEALVAGFVGRFSEQKDPMRFVNAINEARRSRPELIGLMVGDGELRPQLEAAAEPAAIHFTGWANARALMPAMDMLVMTSRYEAMPYTLLEALSAGLPLVSTDVGGVHETLAPGQNGLCLPVDATAAKLAIR